MIGDSLVHCHPTSVPGILARMRHVLLLTGLLCAAAPALAQVTVDLHALDALPGAKPAAPQPPAHRTRPQPAPHPLAAAKSKKPANGQAGASPVPAPAAAPAASPTPSAPTPASAAANPAPSAATPPPPAATLPTAPPSSVALAPIAPPPPPAQATPPPPPPISDTANSSASQSGGGLRVTFGGGQADLSPASAAAIHDLVQASPAGADTSFNVVAYAAGTPEDPSTARRLSLARALAVRSALIADGVSSSHIYVRALGAPDGDKTPDRVDLAVLGGNAPAGTPASAPGSTPPADKSPQP